MFAKGCFTPSTDKNTSLNNISKSIKKNKIIMNEMGDEQKNNSDHDN